MWQEAFQGSEEKLGLFNTVWWNGELFGEGDGITLDNFKMDYEC